MSAIDQPGDKLIVGRSGGDYRPAAAARILLRLIMTLMFTRFRICPTHT
jgi:hypothetical protein